MDLMTLVLLGLGAKVILGKKKEPTAQEASMAPSPYAPSASLPSSKDPYKRPPTLVHDDVEWGSENRLRESVLRRGAELAMDYAPNEDEAMIEGRYGRSAKAAEAAPLTVGAKSAALMRENERMARMVRQEEKILRDAAAMAMDFDENDVVPVSDAAVEMVKYRRDRARAAELGKDAALAARSAAIEAKEDQIAWRENEERYRRQGKDIERSIRREVDPNLDMALRQGHRAQKGHGFAQQPQMGFVEAQPVSLREGNYDQSEVVPASEFNNHLAANQLYAKGRKDWPAAVEQKNMNSDFAGVLVNEKGSPDFSHEIVYDVSDDFGG